MASDHPATTAPVRTTRLDPARSRLVLDLADRAAAADGTDPLNEAARLVLGGADAAVVHQLVERDSAIVGYSCYDPAFGSGQLVVDPAHRRRGIGSALLAGLQSDGCGSVWAFGNLPAAQGFAAAHGYRPGRGLLVLARELRNTDTRPTPPPGIRLRGFDPDGDAAGFLAVNARAFAHHPEQGQFSLADLQARMAEDWFDPAGLIVAEDASGICGFHWTKRHDADTGEVYVIGVDPRTQGTGLGRVLLRAGLARLREIGCREVLLYVDADNTAASRLYYSDGFTLRTSDICYQGS